MSYDPRRAADYWTERVQSEDEFRAVVGLSTPEAVNAAFDAWEAWLIWKYAKHGPSLDIGCGVGRHTARLPEPAVGIDLSPGMIDRARENVPRAVFHVGAADDLDVPNGAAGTVLCLGVLEHVPSAVGSEVLAEAVRVLRPGGRLLVAVNNRHSRWLEGDNPHRQGKQLQNGYFNSLCEPDEVYRSLRGLGLQVKYKRANVAYSVLRHTTSGERWMRMAAWLDSRFPYLPRLFASLPDHVVLIADRPRSES